MPAKAFTARFVESAKVTERTDFQDTVVRGLWLRISPSGLKTWNLLYRRESDGSKQRLKLGRFPAMSLEAARNSARKALVAAADGNDPAGSRRSQRASLTVQELGALYIDRYAKPRKRTWAEDERILRVDVFPIIGRMKANTVRRRGILDLLDAKVDAGAPTQARLVLAVVRKMFNWAVEESYLDASPAHGIKPRSKVVRRDRVLTDAELSRVWSALPRAGMFEQTRDIIRLLILTGQRSGEVCGMRRGEIDLAQALWTIPADRTKNGLSHTVPLSIPALDVVRRALGTAAPEADAPLFSRNGGPFENNAISKAARLKLQMLENPWTPHDIRRTVSTGMARIGIAPHVVEACLNHVSGFRAGVAGIYNRHQYDAEKRRALDMWAEHVGVVVNDREPVVVPFTNGAT